jgi:hypothetical protein
MINIVRGSDRTIRLQLRKSSGEPYDLTACSAAKATFSDEDDKLVTRTLVDGQITFPNRGGGVLDIRLAKEFTAKLKIAERQAIQIEVVVSTDTRKIMLYESLTVIESMEDDV